MPIHKMKLFVISVLLLCAVNAHSQNSTCFANPKIWLRADNPGVINTQWQDVSGNGFYATVDNNGVLPDTTLFNYNRCFLFDSSSNKLNLSYLASSTAKLLVFAVYRPYDPIPESGIWNLSLDSNIQVRLTTQKLKNVFTVFPYSDSTSTTPIINLLSQHWKNKTIDSSYSRLIVAGTDSLCFTGKFAEFILYDTTLGANDIYKLHTYLAIKYGVSIKDMNYVLSNDSMLWDYEENIDYTNDIAAIGMDSIIDVHQKQSAGNGGESPLKIAAGSLCTSNVDNQAQISEGDFLIWGHNGKALNDISSDSLSTGIIDNLSKCVWMMKTAGASHQNIPTQVVLNAADIDFDSLVYLVINRDGDSSFPLDSSIIYPADSVDTLGNYYFSNIQWDVDLSGKDVFTFQVIRKDIDLKTSSSIANADSEDSENEDSGNGNGSGNTDINPANAILGCTLFPNPTAREFTITIKMNSDLPIEVDLRDENGKGIEHFERSGALEYELNGYIDKTGCYFVTVKTNTESKTYKLVVN